jgi:hypothetical protein
MAKKPEEPNLIDRFLEAEWPELRALGRERFVWLHRVLPIGIPLGAFMTIWSYRELGYSFRHLLTPMGAALAYLSFVIAIGITYFSGRLEWDQREEKYQKAHDRRGDDKRT